MKRLKKALCLVLCLLLVTGVAEKVKQPLTQVN